MSDALDRIVPEDKKGRGGNGLYRHDAEGSDDMPVCGFADSSDFKGKMLTGFST